MTHKTLLRWLESSSLNEDEIDFLITFIPMMSVIKTQPNQAAEICLLINQQFPKANLSPKENYLDVHKFTSVIERYTSNKVKTEDLLRRMSSQNLCKPLCEFLLHQAHNAR